MHFDKLPIAPIMLPSGRENILDLNSSLERAVLPEQIGKKGPIEVFPGCREKNKHRLVHYVVLVGWLGSPEMSTSDLLLRMEAAKSRLNLYNTTKSVDGFDEEDLNFWPMTTGMHYINNFMVWQGNFPFQLHIQSQMHWLRMSTFYQNVNLANEENKDKLLKEYLAFAKELGNESDRSAERHAQLVSMRAQFMGMLQSLSSAGDQEDLTEELDTNTHDSEDQGQPIDHTGEGDLD